MRAKRQENLVLAHLEEHGSITPYEAIERYHITRLAAVIFRLKKNHDIRTIIIRGYDENGDNYQYAMYELKKEPHGATNTARLQGDEYEDIFASDDITLPF